jgi:polyhydroxyalkanoate synthase subunit PhaC
MTFLSSANCQFFRNCDSLLHRYALFWENFGLGPIETQHKCIVSSSKRYRLCDYGTNGDGLNSVLIVTSPIKKSYIWDIESSLSAVCKLREKFHVYMLEWLPTSSFGDFDLRFHAETAIMDVVHKIKQRHGERLPFLIGHSMGGILAAMFSSLKAEEIAGLILLSSPLMFHFEGSQFNSRFVELAQKIEVESEEVPGSLLSFLSIVAVPETFLLEPLDIPAQMFLDLKSYKSQARVWRWFIDEVSVPKILSEQVFQKLYVEDQFFNENLRIGVQRIGPSGLRKPTLAVFNLADTIAPRASIAEFLSKAPGETRLMTVPAERGTGIRHLSVLIGAKAHEQTWPRILTWMSEKSSRTERI